MQQEQENRNSYYRSTTTDQTMQPFYMKQTAEASDDEVTIDLGELFGVLWHWIWLILLVALAFGGAAYAFSKFVIPEEFQSTTKIYVLDKEGGSGQNTYTDLQVGSQLTKDYAELITSRTVIEKVIADNHLESVYDYNQFLKKVAVDTPTDTRIVSITVTDTDPALAQKLADDIRAEASDLIINTMQIDAVNTYEEANLPTEKSGPSCSKWALIGALIGALLVAAIVTLQYILDDTIKTSEDVEQYLGMSTLALIPLDENIVNAEKGKGKKGKKSRNKPEKGGHTSQRNPREQEWQERAPRRAPEETGESRPVQGRRMEDPAAAKEQADTPMPAPEQRPGRTHRVSMERPEERPDRAGEKSERGTRHLKEESPRRKPAARPQRKPQVLEESSYSEEDELEVDDFLTDEELHDVDDYEYGTGEELDESESGKGEN